MPAATDGTASAGQDGCSTADPRVNNTDAENVAITATELDPASTCGPTLGVDEGSGGVAGGVPPGSITLIVFEHGGEIFSDSFESGDRTAW